MSLDTSSWFQGKSFSTEWGTGQQSTWATIFESRRSSVGDALEIGCWEGRSTIFWLNYFSACHIVCVDNFTGGDEVRTDPDFVDSLRNLEERFDDNVHQYSSRVEKIRLDSRDALSQLGLAGRRFDFIYIDGSHHAIDVYTDATLAWPMLKPGGVMLFDDYEWIKFSDAPKLGIDAFLSGATGTFQELRRGYQLLIEKKQV